MTFRRYTNIQYLLGALSLTFACGAIEFFYPGRFYTGPVYMIAVLLTYPGRNKLYPLITAWCTFFIITARVIIAVGTESFNTGLAVTYTGTLAGTLAALIFVLYILYLQRKNEKDIRQANSLIAYASEGIILTNGKGEIILVNPMAMKMFGYATDELKGKRIEVLIPDDLRQKHEGHVKGFHAHPSNRSMGIGRDLYAKRKDGSVFPVEVSLSPYKSNNESFVIGFVIDITIRKQNEESIRQKNLEVERAASEIKQLNTTLEQKVTDRTTMLRETLEQLELSKDELAESLEKEKELSDLKSRFVSTVSHEFRTPLSTILSSAALIGKYVKETEQDKRDRHIARIKESVKHMSNMLEDLLLLGKLEEGLTEIKKDEIDLKFFMTEFVNEMQELAHTGQQIVLNTPNDIQVITDKRLLKHILLNLTSNAIKFSPENSEISLIVHPASPALKISVKDNGIGIGEEDRQHLFERFFRSNSVQNIQGTGLGLHIVSKYLELLDGKVELQSEPGKGSTFTITIPLFIEKN